MRAHEILTEQSKEFWTNYYNDQREKLVFAHNNGNRRGVSDTLRQMIYIAWQSRDPALLKAVKDLKAELENLPGLSAYANLPPIQ